MEKETKKQYKPRYPDNLAMIDKVDINSTGKDLERQFPIMSVSKSFCGALSALMAVEGEFGNKGIGSTLSEVLEVVKSKYSDRSEKAEQYLKMLTQKGFGDVTISELLTHKSGIRDDHETPFASYSKKTPLEFFNDKLSRSNGSENFEKGKYNYSNNGYILMQEIINLSCQSGNYEQELKNRIFDPLKLKKTGSISNSPEAQEKIGQAIFLPGHKMGSAKIENYTIRRADQLHPLGQIPLAAFGLCSTINDMKIYSVELAKFITGTSNKLTDQPESIRKIYQDSYHNCFEEEGGYSLGICILQNQDKNFTIHHRGGFDTNGSLMRVETSYPFLDFTSGKSINLADNNIISNISMHQHDCLAANILLPKGGKNMWQFLVKNYLDENGIINSAKVTQDFHSFEEIDRLCLDLEAKNTALDLEKTNKPSTSPKDFTAKKYGELIGKTVNGSNEI